MEPVVQNHYVFI